MIPLICESGTCNGRARLNPVFGPYVCSFTLGTSVHKFIFMHQLLNAPLNLTKTAGSRWISVLTSTHFLLDELGNLFASRGVPLMSHLVSQVFIEESKAVAQWNWIVLLLQPNPYSQITCGKHQVFARDVVNCAASWIGAERIVVFSCAVQEF